ncbi:MAG: hypothetical protein JWP27_2439 [Flaviaesturariibacter sp.]|nr:hypothetical protein [Flaviaesturariibacter sp.]
MNRVVSEASSRAPREGAPALRRLSSRRDVERAFEPQIHEGCKAAQRKLLCGFLCPSALFAFNGCSTSIDKRPSHYSLLTIHSLTIRCAFVVQSYFSRILLIDKSYQTHSTHIPASDTLRTCFGRASVILRSIQMVPIEKISKTGRPAPTSTGKWKVCADGRSANQSGIIKNRQSPTCNLAISFRNNATSAREQNIFIC